MGRTYKRNDDTDYGDLKRKRESARDARKAKKTVIRVEDDAESIARRERMRKGDE